MSFWPVMLHRPAVSGRRPLFGGCPDFRVTENEAVPFHPAGKCVTKKANRSRRLSLGYTLVEILVAVTLTSILMTAVMRVFVGVGASISEARRALETFDRLRATASLLRMDLQGVTVTMSPPIKPESGEGYFEYVEGHWIDPPAKDFSVTPPADDYTVGQRGDILMFTTRNGDRPFVGRYHDPAHETDVTIQSDVAEVAWFLRGHTLHRRVLLVVPEAKISQAKPFYDKNDISVYLDPLDPQRSKLVANSLSSLTKRECRYAHPTDMGFPYDVRRWGLLGLPTLWECSFAFPMAPPPNLPTFPQGVDMWARMTSEANKSWVPDYYLLTGNFDAPTGALATAPTLRPGDDVVMTNVIEFDVKAWDPGAGDAGAGVQNGKFVDLGNQQGMAGATSARFYDVGDTKSGLKATTDQQTKLPITGCTYDTWSFHYENEGINGSGQGAGTATNGFDDGPNGANGIVDDPTEWISSPPYLTPLRGIQVKIRVFEPDSRQIKEVTIEQDFPSK